MIKLLKLQLTLIEKNLNKPNPFYIIYYKLLKQINKQEFAVMLKKYDHDVIFSVETAIKYAGYEARELERIAKIKKLDGLTISKSVDYKKITNLSAESIEKLSFIVGVDEHQLPEIENLKPPLTLFFINNWS